MSKNLKLDVLEECMRASYNAAINKYLMGEYENLDMLDQCMNDINEMWALLLADYFRKETNEDYR